MSDKEKYQFPGKDVAVEWDGRLCIHIAECGQAKGELFVGGRQPWCQPDLVSLQEVIDVVERCPSGALTYEVSDNSVKEKTDDENTVTVSYNGPYFVRGEIDLQGAADDMKGTAFRVALCRCGHSKNKPFCDNSHEAASSGITVPWVTKAKNSSHKAENSPSNRWMTDHYYYQAISPSKTAVAGSPGKEQKLRCVDVAHRITNHFAMAVINLPGSRVDND